MVAVILYPAIDLKDGRCVRLIKGDMSRATEFNADPADQARQFVAAVATILAAAEAPVQLGGGIRDLATIESWLGRGVARVILGTAAVKNPDLVKAACKAHPGRIAVGIDAKAGLVATEGWAEATTLSVIDLANRFVDAGVTAIIHTDIDRDGVLGGPNVAASAALARAVPIPVIVSGGVSSLDDLVAIKAEARAGIAGAISGRAIYDGRIDLTAAIRLMRG